MDTRNARSTQPTGSQDDVTSRSSMKRSAERKALVISLLDAHGFVSIEALAKACGASTQTMRRDLAALSTEGRIERFHGGASLPSAGAQGNFAKRSATHVAEKRSAASLLPEVIPEGASVFLGGGSTVTLAAEQLRAHKQLMVITNNLQAAVALYDKEGFEVVVTGGRIRVASGSLVGDDTTNYVERFFADYYVFSTAGIAPDGTLLEFDQTVVAPVKAMLRNARKRVLIADSSKFNGRGVVRCGTLAEMDYLLTDRVPPANIMELIKENGVELRIPDDAKPMDGAA